MEAVVVGETVGCLVVVESSVGVEGANEAKLVASGQVVEDIEHHGVVVAVRSVGRERDRDAVVVGGDHELPAAFTWVFGIEPGAGTALWGGVVAAVDEQVGEIDADHAVIGGEGVDQQFLEQPGLFPLVATGSQGGVGHRPVEHELDGVPRGAGDQSQQEPTEDHPVRGAGSVASQRVRWRGRDQVFNKLKDRVVDAGFESVHHGR